MRAESSVTRWVDYFAINGHLKQRKIAHLHKIYAKVQIFTNCYINSQKIAKDLVNFAEVVKFHQIWSHWLKDFKRFKNSISQLKNTNSYC